MTVGELKEWLADEPDESKVMALRTDHGQCDDARVDQAVVSLSNVFYGDIAEAGCFGDEIPRRLERNGNELVVLIRV